MSRSARDVRSAPRRGTRVGTALAAASVLLVAGCAAGQISQTAQQVAAIDGANGTVGTMGVRDALIATPSGSLYGAGSELPLQLTLINTGDTDDILTSVTSPMTDPWSGEIKVPASSNVAITKESQVGVTLPALKNTLCYGQSISMTFTFATAGAVTVRVTTNNPPERTGTRETIEILPPHPTPLWETGAHADEHAAESAEPSAAVDPSTDPSSPLNCNGR